MGANVFGCCMIFAFEFINVFMKFYSIFIKVSIVSRLPLIIKNMIAK